LVSRPLNKEKESSNDQIVDTAPSPEKSMEHSFQSEQIEKALNKLSKDQRAVITLHDIEGYQLTELEVLLEVPLGTLKSRLHRARVKLRENLKKMEPFLSDYRLHN
jgi:RNA polymerase sigma-70 factor (ECF subfamily)